MNNEIERVLISEKELEEINTAIAKKINSEFQDEEVMLVIILKGSLMFSCDLMKKLTMPVIIDFMQASSYFSGTVSANTVQIKRDLQEDITGKNVILIEDIIDSGNTLFCLKNILLRRNPKSLKICTLLDKPARRVADISPDYIGKEIEDEFVIGYGLDYDQKYRNLPYVGILSRSVYEK